jgi:hypothetical protein
MLNTFGNVDNCPLPPKYPIHPRNPPDLTRVNSFNPRHPRSIPSQNESASNIRNVPSIGLYPTPDTKLMLGENCLPERTKSVIVACRSYHPKKGEIFREIPVSAQAIPTPLGVKRL